MDLHFDKPEWCNDCVFGEESGYCCSLLDGELCYEHGDYEKRRPEWCPFDNDGKTIIAGGVVLLKEQKAVEPILIREGRNKHYNDYVCPRCDNEVICEQNYCSECGVRFLWERSVKLDGTHDNT